MVWFFRKNDTDDTHDQERLHQEASHDSPHAPKEQDEDLPMDIGTLQDIFSFSFIRGRPIMNFLLAIVWSIGLPILLYHLLLPHIGQVLAMIAASSPPLVIVIIRILKEKTVDILGIVAGLSFLISGIISIAEPDEKTSAICESIVPLLVGVFCLVSLIPFRVGAFESRPLVYQMANQIMPRQEEDETLTHYDDQRTSATKTKRQKLDYLYTHLGRFRRDMRVMTACWGVTLVVTFIIKVIVVMTNTDTSHAETVGYIVFGLATGLMIVFTWLYTKVVKRHVTDTTKEGLHNVTWGVQSFGNTFVFTGNVLDMVCVQVDTSSISDALRGDHTLELPGIWLNIANPATGCQKLIEIDDERRLRGFYDKRMSQEVPGDALGDEFKGYVFRISGGNDKQGFPMKQGVLLPHRVRLLLSKGHSCYRPRRTGERKRKSVRGCIVSSDLAVLSLVVVKQGEQDIPGLTDIAVPKRLGPKRASKIRKFFNLSHADDVRKYVIRREVQPKNPEKKPYTKAPKIQRLVTPATLQRKRHRVAIKRRRAEASKEAEAEYKQLLAKRVKETKDKKLERRRTSSMQKSASA